MKIFSFNRLVQLLIINCTIFLSIVQIVHAINTDSQKNISTEPTSEEIIPEKIDTNNDLGINDTETTITSPDVDNALPSILNKKEHQKINLTIHINVPHNNKAVDWCRIYPYPVAPPKIKTEVERLPIRDKQLRSLILAIAYWNKTRTDKPYPAGGWRMQYALQSAIAKSGLNAPHTIVTEYPWADNILPYIRKEVIVINAKELDRKKRHKLAQTIFDEHRADLEVQAFNKGLFPIDVPISRERGGHRKGKTLVDKANWWIVVIHKIPGLKYYWLWPVRLNDNPEQLVTLNEDNAIYIEGAW